MAEKTYWMRDLSGAKALMVGVDGRDEWIPRGWSVTDEPTDPDFVWMHKPELDNPGLIAWGAREYWQGIGWAPGTPPVPIDPTKDPVLTDVKPVAAPPEPAAKKTSAATAAPNKEV